MAVKIVDMILDAAAYCLSLFDQMLDATGLFGWFTFCFFTFMVFKYLIMPLVGHSIDIGKSDESAFDKARKKDGFEFSKFG